MKGWQRESKRHSLAAQGIITGRKIRDFHVFIRGNADTDNDGHKNIDDPNPWASSKDLTNFTYKEQTKLHRFLETVMLKAHDHKVHTTEEINAAIEQIKQITSPQHLKA